MSESVTKPDNYFLSGSLPVLFLKTAAPIVSIMVMNGLFTLVDAYFLGRYVGATALTAVTLMFPVYMLLIALSTLVSNGFSSVYARALGAAERDRSQAVFIQALTLSLVICFALIVLFLAVGADLTRMAANDSAELSAYGYTYISILIFCSPLVFVLGIKIDALRCEGLLPVMAAVAIMSSLLNILFDYLFIAEFGWGVAGSAWGTVLAQFCSLLAVLSFRVKTGRGIGVPALGRRINHWGELLALGAPTSLGYIGISLSAGLTLFCLQLWAGEHYEPIAGAFGIITRLMTFAFLPLLGISIAFQTIVGNNFGARDWLRSNSSIRIAVIAALAYCIIVETVFLASRQAIGFVFVDDVSVAGEMARILPYSVAMMFVFGPLMIIGSYFQAIGDAPRAAALGLTRTYMFGLPLTFLLPFFFGEPGIWYAGVVAELMVLSLTIGVLWHRRNRTQLPWGLFEPVAAYSENPNGGLTR